MSAATVIKNPQLVALEGRRETYNAGKRSKQLPELPKSLGGAGYQKRWA